MASCDTLRRKFTGATCTASSVQKRTCGLLLWCCAISSSVGNCGPALCRKTNCSHVFRRHQIGITSRVVFSVWSSLNSSQGTVGECVCVRVYVCMCVLVFAYGAVHISGVRVSMNIRRNNIMFMRIISTGQSGACVTHPTWHQVPCCCPSRPSHRPPLAVVSRVAGPPAVSQTSSCSPMGQRRRH